MIRALTGNQVRVRILAPEDAPALLALLAQPELYEHTPGVPLRRLSQAQALISLGTGNVFAIEQAGRLVGTIELRLLEEEEGVGEIGFLIAPAQWGRGIATEAARLVMGLGFSELGLERIQATCSPENKASRRVLEKVGMQLEGHLRGYRVQKGRRVDKLLFARLRED